MDERKPMTKAEIEPGRIVSHEVDALLVRDESELSEYLENAIHNAGLSIDIIQRSGEELQRSGKEPNLPYVIDRSHDRVQQFQGRLAVARFIHRHSQK